MANHVNNRRSRRRRSHIPFTFVVNQPPVRPREVSLQVTQRKWYSKLIALGTTKEILTNDLASSIGATTAGHTVILHRMRLWGIDDPTMEGGRISWQFNTMPTSSLPAATSGTHGRVAFASSGVSGSRRACIDVTMPMAWQTFPFTNTSDTQNLGKVVCKQITGNQQAVLCEFEATVTIMQSSITFSDMDLANSMSFDCLS